MCRGHKRVLLQVVPPATRSIPADEAPRLPPASCFEVGVWWSVQVNKFQGISRLAGFHFFFVFRVFVMCLGL